MFARSLLCASALVLTLCAAAAAAPADNINPNRHPNLAAAQRLVSEAYGKIAAAQSANEFDLGGHAARAKELLDQVNRKLKAAAMTANEAHH